MDPRPFSPDTTVFVTTIGDQANFEDCLLHLAMQTLDCGIEIIDRVAPMSAALQEMHHRCQTPFYIQVDEDMILFPDAVQRLEEMMRQAPPDVALICASLWDCDTGRAIHGVKIYRSDIVRNFPYENTLSCEISQVERLEAAGYTVVRLPKENRDTCLGEHGKHYTPQTIFIRWQRSFQKHLQMGCMKWIASYPEWLLKRYLETREPLHLYAFLGAVAGITGAPAENAELDFRVPNEALLRLQRYFAVESADKTQGASR